MSARDTAHARRRRPIAPGGHARPRRARRPARRLREAQGRPEGRPPPAGLSAGRAGWRCWWCIVLMLLSTGEHAGRQLLPEAADQRLHPAGRLRRPGARRWRCWPGSTWSAWPRPTARAGSWSRWPSAPPTPCAATCSPRCRACRCSYFDGHTHGELMSRFTNDIDNVQMAFEQSLVQLISSALTFVGAIVMMLVLSPILLLVTAGGPGRDVLHHAARSAARAAPTSRRSRRNLGNVNGYVEEMVEGLKVVKVFSHERPAIAEFKKRNEAYRQAATNANFYAGDRVPDRGQPQQHRLRGHRPGGRAARGVGPLRHRLAGRLPAVFAAGGHAGAADHQPVQHRAGGAGRRRAGLRGDGPGSPRWTRAAWSWSARRSARTAPSTPNHNGAHPTHWAWHCPQAGRLAGLHRAQGRRPVPRRHLRLRARHRRCCTTSRCTPSPARRSPSSARPARARPPSPT